MTTTVRILIQVVIIQLESRANHLNDLISYSARRLIESVELL